jgi:glutaredoxin
MRILIAMMLFATALPAAAQLYRWTDKSGNTHFTDTPPPPGARNVQKRKPPAAGGGAETAALPFALQQAMKSAPITLYTTPGCEGCGEARKLLNGRGIPFKEVSVNSEAQLAELKNAVGSNSVPAMIVGSNIVKGFEEGQYHAALDGAGYPRAGILKPRAQTEPPASDAQSAAPSGEAPAEPAPVKPTGPYAPR